MIAIDYLRYVQLGTRDLPAAVDFAERILGLQLVNRGETAAYFPTIWKLDRKLAKQNFAPLTA